MIYGWFLVLDQSVSLARNIRDVYACVSNSSVISIV